MLFTGINVLEYFLRDSVARHTLLGTLSSDLVKIGISSLCAALAGLAVGSATIVAGVAGAPLVAVIAAGVLVGLSFDSGRHYLVLMLIFPWLHLCGILNRRVAVALKTLSKLTIALFIGLILGAWGSVQYVQDRLERAGYKVCAGPEQHRVSPGAHRICALSNAGCRAKVQN